MRYTCGKCGSWVKDKFIFGTLHLCINTEERERAERAIKAQRDSLHTEGNTV